MQGLILIYMSDRHRPGAKRWLKIAEADGCAPPCGVNFGTAMCEITLGIYGHVIGDEQRNTAQNHSPKLVTEGQLLESGVLLEIAVASR